MKACLFIIGNDMFVKFGTDQDPNTSAMSHLIAADCEPTLVQGVDKNKPCYFIPVSVSLDAAINLVANINS